MLLRPAQGGERDQPVPGAPPAPAGKRLRNPLSSSAAEVVPWRCHGRGQRSSLRKPLGRKEDHPKRVAESGTPWGRCHCHSSDSVRAAGEPRFHKNSALRWEPVAASHSTPGPASPGWLKTQEKLKQLPVPRETRSVPVPPGTAGTRACGLQLCSSTEAQTGFGFYLFPRRTVVTQKLVRFLEQPDLSGASFLPEMKTDPLKNTTCYKLCLIRKAL